MGGNGEVQGGNEMKAQTGMEMMSNEIPEVEIHSLTKESYDKLSDAQKQVYDSYKGLQYSPFRLSDTSEGELHYLDALDMVEGSQVGNIFNEPRINATRGIKMDERGLFRAHAYPNPFSYLTPVLDALPNLATGTQDNFSENISFGDIYIPSIMTYDRQSKTFLKKKYGTDNTHKIYMQKLIAELAHIDPDVRQTLLEQVMTQGDRLNRGYKNFKKVHNTPYKTMLGITGMFHVPGLFNKLYWPDKSNYTSHGDYEHHTHYGPESAERALIEKYSKQPYSGITTEGTFRHLDEYQDGGSLPKAQTGYEQMMTNVDDWYKKYVTSDKFRELLKKGNYPGASNPYDLWENYIRNEEQGFSQGPGEQVDVNVGYQTASLSPGHNMWYRNDRGFWDSYLDPGNASIFNIFSLNDFEPEDRTLRYDPEWLKNFSSIWKNVDPEQVLAHEYGHFGHIHDNKGLHMPGTAGSFMSQEMYDEILRRQIATKTGKHPDHPAWELEQDEAWNRLSEEERKLQLENHKSKEEWFKHRIKHKREHDVMPYETRADIMGLRYMLDKHGIYKVEDTRDFNMDDLNKIFEKEGVDKRLLRLYDKNDIIWLMNNVAFNEEIGDDLPEGDAYAKYGKELSKAQYGVPSNFDRPENIYSTREKNLKAKNYLREYIMSPMYLERLAIEFPGMSERELKKERNARLKNLNTVSVSIPDKPLSSSGNYGGILGEYLADDHHIQFEPNPYYDYQNINLHEYSHAIDDERISNRTIDFIDSITKESEKEKKPLNYNPSIDYLREPTEFIARIQAVRYAAFKEGLYDPMNEKFTKEHLKLLKNNLTVKYDNHFEDLYEILKGDKEEKDKNFIKSMNEIAMEPASSMDFAKKGIELRKHTIVKGDNGKRLKAMYGTELKDILKHNNIKYFKLGDEIEIPKYQDVGEFTGFMPNPNVSVSSQIEKEENKDEEIEKSKKVSKKVKKEKEEKQKELEKFYIPEHTISAYEEPSTWDVISNTLANPVAAFGYSARNQDVPWGRIPSDENLFDMAIGMYNPFKAYEYGTLAVDDFKEGDYLGGTLNTLGAAAPIPFIKQASNLRHVNKPFKSQINWAKWNPEIPKNKALLDEYAHIEKITKSRGTWMKNPDGTPFQGSPEQFVQMRSKNFNLAYPDGATVVFRGQDYADDFLNTRNFGFAGDEGFNLGVKSNPKYTVKFTGDLNVASQYGRFGDNKHLYELAMKNSPKSSINLKAMGKDYGSFDFIGKPKSYFQNAVNNQQKIVDDLFNARASQSQIEDALQVLNRNKRALQNYDELITNPNYTKLVDDIKTGKFKRNPNNPNKDLISTDDLAQWVQANKLDNIVIDDIYDWAHGTTNMSDQVPGNFLKSLEGNRGTFDLTNPNIYKRYGGQLPMAQNSWETFWNTGKEIYDKGKDLIDTGVKKVATHTVKPIIGAGVARTLGLAGAAYGLLDANLSFADDLKNNPNIDKSDTEIDSDVSTMYEGVYAPTSRGGSFFSSMKKTGGEEKEYPKIKGKEMTQRQKDWHDKAMARGWRWNPDKFLYDITPLVNVEGKYLDKNVDLNNPLSNCAGGKCIEEEPLVDEMYTYETHSDWFDNRAVYYRDENGWPRVGAKNDEIREKVYAGTHGFNPVTGKLTKLDKKQYVPIGVQEKAMGTDDINSPYYNPDNPHIANEFTYISELTGKKHHIDGAYLPDEGNWSKAMLNKMDLEDYPYYLLDERETPKLNLSGDLSIREMFDDYLEVGKGDPDAWEAMMLGDTRYYTNEDGSIDKKKQGKYYAASHWKFNHFNPMWSIASAFHPASWPIYATTGAMKLPGDVKDLTEDPSWGNAGNVAFDLLEITPAAYTAWKNVAGPVKNLSKNISSGMKGIRGKGSRQEIWNGYTWVPSAEQLAIRRIKRAHDNVLSLRHDAKNKVKGAKKKLEEIELKMENMMTNFERLGFDSKVLRDEAYTDMFTEYNKFLRGTKDQKKIIKDYTDEFMDMNIMYNNPGGDKWDFFLDQIRQGRQIDADMIRKHMGKSMYDRFRNLPETVKRAPNSYYDDFAPSGPDKTRDL